MVRRVGPAVRLSGLLLLLAVGAALGLAGCDSARTQGVPVIGTLDSMRRQFVSLRYVGEAGRLSTLHPLDRPLVSRYLGRALALRGDDPIIVSRAASLYMKIEDYAAALPLLERLSSINHSPIWLERGQCLIMTGNLRKGREYLNLAVQDARAQYSASGGATALFFAHTLNNAGYTMADAGVDLTRARAMIEQAVAVAPLEAAYTDSLGWVLYREGDVKMGTFYLERAARLSRDSTIYYHLGAAYAAQRRPDEARRALARALEIDPYNKPAQDELRRLRYHLPEPSRV